MFSHPYRLFTVFPDLCKASSYKLLARRTTPLPPPPLDAPRVVPRPPHARGGAVTVPGCSSALRHNNFPKPCTNFQGTASTERSRNALDTPAQHSPASLPKKQKQQGPTSAAPDDVGESVSGGRFPGLLRTPRLSHSHTPRAPAPPRPKLWRQVGPRSPPDALQSR